MTRTTRKQREALKRIWLRGQGPESYRRLRKSAQPSFDGSGCIMVPWAGMCIGIEPDGYTHS